MSPLDIDALEAGRVYKSTGAIPVNMLRSTVYRAWERSHLQGANPRALQAEILSSLETERLVEQHSDLIDAVRPYFRILSQAVGNQRHAVMLGDRQGILLDAIGDEQTINGPEPFPKPGSLLSEAVAGANGIGTTLAEADYVEIIAAEHFIEGFHPFTCQGIPIRNEKQEIVGVLSISSRQPDAGKRLKEILLCASRAVEAEFIIANLEKDIHRVLTSNPEDYQRLDELRQDLIQANQAGRLKLEVSSRMLAANRIEHAKKLLQQAEQSIQIFRRRADIWHTLASLETGTAKPLSLTGIIEDIVDLLSTEAAIRKIEVITEWQEPITVFTEPRSLLRHLLRYFIQSFEIAGEGGIVKVAVYSMLNSDLVQVSFTSIPGLNTYPLAPKPYMIYLTKTNINNEQSKFNYTESIDSRR
ncbi:transcriptional activator of acetoin/glycerol metabolism [Nostoc sp. PCC 7524]|uniref:GAF domain-containing protein n=1 Tax=Nostoc sp. (strain ATCC 29411 / PCC 7524) TaxID=28072 RepID=UPI00029EF8C0|nr:GAF domain-containing protein [Nostoc sp. PCC 7524]AFY47860.1 transcriptional activator of acetoin/glycerol metabolism [Nostoc sp. PCC 7524]